MTLVWCWLLFNALVIGGPWLFDLSTGRGRRAEYPALVRHHQSDLRRER